MASSFDISPIRSLQINCRTVLEERCNAFFAISHRRIKSITSSVTFPMLLLEGVTNATSGVMKNSNAHQEYVKYVTMSSMSGQGKKYSFDIMMTEQSKYMTRTINDIFLCLKISSKFTSHISRIYDWISGSVCGRVSIFEYLK